MVNAAYQGSRPVTEHSPPKAIFLGAAASFLDSFSNAHTLFLADLSHNIFYIITRKMYVSHAASPCSFSPVDLATSRG